VTLTVEWPEGPTEPTPLHFVVLDYYEQPVQEFDATWAGQPLTCTVQPPRRGIFKLAVGRGDRETRRQGDRETGRYGLPTL
jgi:hypothetical protein